MTTRFVLLGLALAMPLQAQRVTLGANFGGSSAGGDLASSTAWKSGWSAGANLTYRLSGRFGLRADANLAQNDLSGTVAIPGERRFNKVSYVADAVWQREEMPGSRADAEDLKRQESGVRSQELGRGPPWVLAPDS